MRWECTSWRQTAGKATLRVPYGSHLVGNPDTGVIHGGVITSTLDNASGMAVHTALDDWVPIATLDLRIDYMKPASPGRDFFAHAHCYKVTRSIAFVRGVAYHDSADDPIATAAATFMLSSELTEVVRRPTMRLEPVKVNRHQRATLEPR